jgi:hypothetical protein
MTFYNDPCGSISATGGTHFFVSSWGCGFLTADFSPPSTYTVSGKIIDWQGRPIAGVVVQDSLGNSGITDSNGEYHVADVLVGRNTLTAAKAGCTIPSERLEFDTAQGVDDLDFTAGAGCVQHTLMLPFVARNR